MPLQNRRNEANAVLKREAKEDMFVRCTGFSSGSKSSSLRSVLVWILTMVYSSAQESNGNTAPTEKIILENLEERNLEENQIHLEVTVRVWVAVGLGIWFG